MESMSAESRSFDPAFTFAFQPIVDTIAHEVAAHEALIRGPWEEPAWQVLNPAAAFHPDRFDETARTAAVGLAARLGIDRPLHLNFRAPCLDANPKSLLATIADAGDAGIRPDHLVFEVPEAEVVVERTRFAALLREARALGARLAIDDFGATYASLTILDDLEPDQIKLDMRLIRSAERPGPRQAILRAIRRACYDLDIEVIAEGVETAAEYEFLAGQRIRFFQGYLFAKPAFEALAGAHFPPAAGIGESASIPPVRAAGSRAASAARTKKRA